MQEVHELYVALDESDPETAILVDAALGKLEAIGPSLGRPIVDTLSGSGLSNLKELRPASRGASELRLLFVFDPIRRAVVLVAGDKAESWDKWYRQNIPVAEQRYQKWLVGGYQEVIQ